MSKLIKGKRYYWFSESCGCVLSGLYGGEHNKSGSAIIYRKSGDSWDLPEEILFLTEKDAIEHELKE